MNRRRLQSAGAEYTYLRGLFFIPLGGLFFISALGNWEWGPFRHEWVYVAVALLIASSCIPINRYYNETYGRVTLSTRQRIKATVATLAGVGLMLVVSLLLRSEASWSLDLPVNPIAVAFAAAMLAYYALTIGLRTHHVVIWGSLLVAGALPVWDGGEPSNVALVLAGVACIVNGVFDHLLLARIFGRSTTTALGPTNAGA